MSLTAEEIDFATTKQFSKFSDIIQREIKQKIAINPAFIEYSNNQENIQKMKDLFANINAEV